MFALKYYIAVFAAFIIIDFVSTASGIEASRPAKSAHSDSEKRTGSTGFPSDKFISETDNDSSTAICWFYDEPPSPIGGFSAIQAVLNYPESAQKKHIEGIVYVNSHIDRSGKVLETRILNRNSRMEIGDEACQQAAAEAIKATYWRPARQNGRPVSVWIGCPVHFKDNGKFLLGKTVPLRHDPGNMELQPIGGLEQIYKTLEYPMEAVKGGIEGSVHVALLLDEEGNIIESRIAKSITQKRNNDGRLLPGKYLPHDYGCDAAALKAVTSVKYHGELYEGKPAKEWIRVPVNFRLDDIKK